MDDTGERFIPGTAGSIAAEHQHRYAFAAGLIAGGAVLDVACGEGYGAAFLARHAGRVVGVDLDAQAVAHAARRYAGIGNLGFEAGDVGALPFPDHSFDAVVSFETVEHVADPRRALAELRRVLKPGGTLIVSTPDRDVYSGVLNNRNQFHLAELSAGEFEGELRRLFAHVALRGQAVGLASMIAAADERAGAADMWWLHGEAPARAPLPPARPVFLLAVCSDAPLAVPADSVLIDGGASGAGAIETLQAWGNELAGTLDGVRRQAIADYDGLTAQVAALQAAGAEKDGRLAGQEATLREQLRILDERQALIQAQAAVIAEQREAHLSQLRRLAEKDEVLAREIDRLKSAVEAERRARLAQAEAAHRQEIVALEEECRELRARCQAAERERAELAAGMPPRIEQAEQLVLALHAAHGEEARALSIRSKTLRQRLVSCVPSRLRKRLRLNGRTGRERRAGAVAQAAAQRAAGLAQDCLAQCRELRHLITAPLAAWEAAEPAPPVEPSAETAEIAPRVPDPQDDDIRLLESSALFDRAWYAETHGVEPHEAARHYLDTGFRQGANPSLLFSTADYFRGNRDVPSDQNPLLHYLRHGLREGRSLHAPSAALSDTLPDRFWRYGLRPAPAEQGAGLHG
ncbi:class I SAM-dependent methyltransferase [Ancylobacter oerskovii]|uniref:Methyltransferase domain-containing protein n=1 Tax=Ancylobacter oerskovii TaxID=459519 RepID=A0ABW4YXA8_9HYPH|nr:class I SAM-dependent methyltransferase [Ancylobacter oerskovii]MBS7542273.1 methyltransferase domain-containing protein [Ancylobacter oerskovii]